MTRLAWPAVLLIAACDGNGADWDGAVADFEEGLCTSTCRTTPEEACRSDVQTDLAAARELLDPAGEQRCIDCLDTRLRLIPAVEMQSCQPTTAQDSEVIRACGTDNDACARVF
ncbi:MAG: hypothetical protein H0T42_13775 [Deltaproteobacteria bacterium]|nr:hypothetical protein [Deltaproteobacteria bacterium]